MHLRGYAYYIRNSGSGKMSGPSPLVPYFNCALKKTILGPAFLLVDTRG